MSREVEDREVVHVVQSQSGSVVVTCAEDEAASSEAARARASGSLTSLFGPRATRISVTSYEEEATPPPGGIEKLCMIVDRFESDARRISRGSMLDAAEGASSPTGGGGAGGGPATRQPHPRKASHQPARSPRLSPRPPLAGQRSHHDLMLLGPNRSKGSPMTSFVESVRKSSFSSKMAEIFDGDSPSGVGVGGGGFSVVSCAAAAAVSEVAATVAVNCTAATDDEDDGEDDRLIGGGGGEVTWRVASSISSSSTSSSSADHVSSMSKIRVALLVSGMRR